MQLFDDITLGIGLLWAVVAFAVPAIALYLREPRRFLWCAALYALPAMAAGLLAALAVLGALTDPGSDDAPVLDRPIWLAAACFAAGVIAPALMFAALRGAARPGAEGGARSRAGMLRGLSGICAVLTMAVPGILAFGALALLLSETDSQAWPSLTERPRPVASDGCLSRPIPVRIAGREITLPNARAVAIGTEEPVFVEGRWQRARTYLPFSGEELVALCGALEEAAGPPAIVWLDIDFRHSRYWNALEGDDILKADLRRVCDRDLGPLETAFCTRAGATGIGIGTLRVVATLDPKHRGGDWAPTLTRRAYATARAEEPWAFGAARTEAGGEIRRFPVGYMLRDGHPDADLVGYCPFSLGEFVECSANARIAGLFVQWAFTAPSDDPSGAFLRTHDAVLGMLAPLGSGG